MRLPGLFHIVYGRIDRGLASFNCFWIGFSIECGGMVGADLRWGWRDSSTQDRESSARSKAAEPGQIRFSSALHCSRLAPLLQGGELKGAPRRKRPGFARPFLATRSSSLGPSQMGAAE